MPIATPPVPGSSVVLALSAPRVTTYLRACGNDQARALELYAWNARVSAAFMLPSHYAEVATRNAVDEALVAVYGANWPWDRTFTRSLPSPKVGYNPQRDLTRVRSKYPTTGKVIAELKFVFWQKMFTGRHDARLWTPHIQSLFPNATERSPAALRSRVYNDLEAVRSLRNRIAHHEPIFTRNATDDLRRMMDLVQLRCQDTAAWVRALEDVSDIVSTRP